MVFIKEAGDYIIKETRGNRTTSKCVVSRLVSVRVCVCVLYIQLAPVGDDDCWMAAILSLCELY